MVLVNGVRGVRIDSFRYSKEIVVFTYKTSKEWVLAVYLYIGISDLKKFILELYRSGVSPQAKQKLLYVFLNLASGFAILDSTDDIGKELILDRVSLVAYAPIAAGIIIKTFTRAKGRKVKLALVTKENSLIKELTIENAGQFDPKKILNQNVTLLTSGDALDNAYAEQSKLLETLRKMKAWDESFEKRSTHIEQLTNSQESSNEEVPFAQVTEEHIEGNEGLLNEGLEHISENE